MNIYVGNLSRDLNEGELREAFAAFGDVASAAIIKDKFSGETRGFGFVEMPNKDEADKAIAAQCLECAGGTILERKYCSCECQLWPYRFGCDPSRVSPLLLDKKNFAEGAMFGFDKEVAVAEVAFQKASKAMKPRTLASPGPKGSPPAQGKAILAVQANSPP